MKSKPAAQSKSARVGRSGRIVRVLGFIALGVFAHHASAGLIATNAAVPTIMDAGGTAEDPAVYRYDGYAPGTTNTAMRIGHTKSYNHLEVVNASVVAVASGSFTLESKVLGYTSGTGHNSLLIGSGSILTVASGGAAFYMGNQSDYNELRIEGGASLVMVPYWYIGMINGAGSYNAITIDGGSYTNNAGRVYFTGTTGNSLVVQNAGRWHSSRFYIGSDSSQGNTVLVTGSNSTLAATSALFVGSDAAANSNNTLTVDNGALVKFTYGSLHSSYCLRIGTAVDNYIRLAGGYVAAKPFSTTYVPESRILVWNGSSWEPGDEKFGADTTGNYTRKAYGAGDEALALAETGYAGLAGYTVLSGGMAIIPPPPKTTLMIVR